MTHRPLKTIAAAAAMLLGLAVAAIAQEAPVIYALQGPDSTPPPQTAHLKMGNPSSPAGPDLGVNSRWYTKGGKAWLPVMGELHYFRVPRGQWEDSLRAMKANGVEIIASYQPWIAHEEKRGVYDWSGNKDLRAFVELCKKHGLYFWLRPGPWIHSEMRNGGFPDWLDEVCRPRTMDPAYFAEVAKWYAEVGKQVKGLLYKDGGPMIGVQFDNEFGHVGGRGDGEAAHIMKLKEIGNALGWDVPYYSVTAWGDAWVPGGEALPMQSTYLDFFWATGMRPSPPAKELVFSDLMTIAYDSNLAADAKAGLYRRERLRYDPALYPHSFGELGGGMHAKYPRRPLHDANDLEAMALTRLGEGSNLLGYYMFSGGTQPRGETGWLIEDGMPLAAYDFQAPLGEAAKTHPSYDRIKKLHQFTMDFGDQLARLIPSLPADPPAPGDTDKLRVALRSAAGKGFVFFSNYQHGMEMPAKQNVQFSVQFAREKIVFPSTPISIPSGAVGILPVNLPLGDGRLVWSTGQPQMGWTEGSVYTCVLTQVFAGKPIELALDGFQPIDGATLDGTRQVIQAKAGTELNLITTSNNKVNLLFLSANDGLAAWNATLDGKRRVIQTGKEVWQDGDGLTIRQGGSGQASIFVWPKLDKPLFVAGAPVASTEFGPTSRFDLGTFNPPAVKAAFEPTTDIPAEDNAYLCNQAETERKAWKVKLDGDWSALDDLTLDIDYVGDTARLYLDGKLIHDDFWRQNHWELSMAPHRAGLAKTNGEMTLVIGPWKQGQQTYVTRIPALDGDATAKLNAIEAKPWRKLNVAAK